MAAHGVLQQDDNGYPVMGGVSSADATQVKNSVIDSVTGRLKVDASGATGTFVTNEVVAGSGTTFTLANTPISGSQAVYGNGQRLTPGAGKNYTISTATLTMANSYSAGTVLADYRY